MAQCPCLYFVWRTVHFWQWGVKVPYYKCVAVNIFFEVLQDFLYVFGCSYVGCIYIYNFYVFLVDCSFEYYEVTFWVSLYGLSLEVYFFWYEYCYPAFFVSCLFAWKICFQPFIFSLCRSLVLRWVSWGSICVGSYFLIHSAILCLLIGAFNPFTFKVIIDRYLFFAVFYTCIPLSLYSFP